MDSDPDLEIIDKIDKDSGMASKDDTPERKSEVVARPAQKKGDDDDDYEDEPDETLGERLWGLTEMFPEPIRNGTAAITDFTCKGVSGIYRLTCNASWIFFTSSMILFAPVIFETERAQVEAMQKSQQKQLLLGTGGGGGAGGMPGMPQM